VIATSNGETYGRSGVTVDKGFSPSEPAPPRSFHYASLRARAAAAVIDIIALQLATVCIEAMFLGPVLQSPTGGNLVLATVGPLILGGAFALFYTVWLECSPWQATLGKRIMGIKVVDLSGGRIGFGTASLRNMAKFLSALTLGIGYLMPLWSPRRQMLHDKAAGCLVVVAASVPTARSVAGLA